MLALCLALLEEPKDEPLFEKFYYKYYTLAYAIVIQHIREQHLAEDCMQEVFANIAKNFHNIKNEQDEKRTKALVRIIARNVSIDMYRKNKKHYEHVVDADITEFFSIADDDFDICDQITLKEAIDKLPIEIQTVFYLKYVCNYNGAEISKMLGISESLVRKRCMIGRQLAKKYIESEK